MPSTVEILLKATDRASKELKGVGKSASEMAGDLKDVAVGLAAGAVAAGVFTKKVFDLGEAGAVVEQTSESFELLLLKVGAAPDLLDQLQTASKGTISDMKLMSSTATLLAGASGDLATNLAAATPELLEIAKAAQKLNPALGDTEFLYKSIATGVKRASPMILDNLGIVIKAGEAYDAMALSLNKTVEELTASEKSQAILNETLKGGRVLIDQVGGNTDSATDSFARLDTAIENLTDELKRSLFPALADAAEGFVTLLTWNDRLAEGLIAHEKEVRDLSESWQDYNTELNRAAEVTGFNVDEQGRLVNITRILGFEIVEVVNAQFSMSEALFNSMSAAEGVSDSWMRMGASIDVSTAALDRHEQVNLRAKTANNKLKTMIDIVGAAFDTEAAKARIVNDAIAKLSKTQTDAARMRLSLKIATGEMTEEQIREARASLTQIDRFQTLSDAVAAGQTSWELYEAIIADNVITIHEMNFQGSGAASQLGVIDEKAAGATDGMGEFHDQLLNVNEALRAFNELSTGGGRWWPLQSGPGQWQLPEDGGGAPGPGDPGFIPPGDPGAPGGPSGTSIVFPNATFSSAQDAEEFAFIIAERLSGG
jgi:hypothetical protein